MSYGSPGDVENNRLVAPKTLKEFEEKANELREKGKSFLKVTVQARNPGGEETSAKEALLNLELVESVWEVE